MEPYEVRASARRKKTMTVFREHGRIVVLVPAHMSLAARERQVPPLVESLLAKERDKRAPRGERELTIRAQELWGVHLRPELGNHPPFGVRWTPNQGKRWGSNTISTGEIRLSDRLQNLPAWVIDAVLVHELVHFAERNHTPRFWRLANRYPKTERARGFLEALDHLQAGGGPINPEGGQPDTLW